MSAIAGAYIVVVGTWGGCAPFPKHKNLVVAIIDVDVCLPVAV